MKKNIIKATLVAAFTLFAGYNVYSSQKSDIMSDLALANIEALAGNESGGGVDCCDSKITCTGAYCGYFTDEHGNRTTVYYK